MVRVERGFLRKMDDPHGSPLANPPATDFCYDDWGGLHSCPERFS